MPKSEILTKAVAERKMERIALEIAEELFGDTDEVIIIGIAGSGMVIAERIYNLVNPLLSIPIRIISCSLNKKKPDTISYSEVIDFNNKNVLLIDDVTNSGRTMLYALKPLLQFYPKRIQTVSLVERMHKNYPIKVDYIGLSVATTLQDHIQVEVAGDEVLGAFIM